MKEQIELKPCPFCGGKSQVRENYLGQTFVFCERCGSITWFTQDDICVRKDIVINNWNSRNQREWISVEDRLPESGAHCILCCDLKCIDGTHRPYVCDGFHVERFSEQASGIDDYCITEYNEEDDEYYIIDGWYEIIKNWDDYGYIAIDDFVTHWMPLPEPPKGE